MYEWIDHTADIGLKVQATTLAELFAEAGQGFTEFIITGNIAPQEVKEISLTADSVEDLFHDWLSELNYLFSVHHLIFHSFTVIEITDAKFTINCAGETYDPKKHLVHTEVKAITYHQIYVKYINNQWQAQIFFDL